MTSPRPATGIIERPKHKKKRNQSQLELRDGYLKARALISTWGEGGGACGREGGRRRD